ncbi:hypothetical protein [Parasediminibacterium sp. JCM 36343]|uniref:hypothetical protein n=1 Tax=Parasediminibacterium sp. JCM 36343 TaxID=3374279 RepID=UPI003979454D
MEKPTTSNFYLAARKIWETVVFKDAPESFELELQLEFHKRLLNIFQAGNFY